MTTSRHRWVQVLTTTTGTTASVVLILAMLRYRAVLIAASRRGYMKASHIAHIMRRTMHTTIRVLKYTFEFLESMSRWQTEIDAQQQQQQQQQDESTFTTPENGRLRRSVTATDWSESDNCDRARQRNSAQLVSTSTVPRSLDRLLALAASPRGASRVAAAGATAGSVAAARGPAALAMVDTCVKALSTPHGTHVLSVAVSSAVDALVGRQPQPNLNFQADTSLTPDVVTSRQPYANFPHRPRSNANNAGNANNLADLAANPNVRSLLTDIAERVTRTAVTHVFPTTPMQDGAAAQMRPSVSSSNPSTNAHNVAPGAQWERLVLAVLKDRPLVRELVRVAVAQAVRSYVVTHAELRTKECAGDGDTNGISSRCDRSNDDGVGKKDSCGDSDSNDSKISRDKLGQRSHHVPASPLADQRENDGVGQPRRARTTRNAAAQPVSMWNAIARLAAVDMRRLLYQQQGSTTSTGWTVF